MGDRIVMPAEIAAQSFAVIRAEMRQMGYKFSAPEQAIVERVIHSTADFEFADLLRFSSNAVAQGTAALQRGAAIVVDVNMVRVGINQRRVQALGSAVHCFVGDVTAHEASASGLTRTAAALLLAHEKGVLSDAVVVVGNAPTALFTLMDLIDQQQARPALVVGVPVGFINTAESKDAVSRMDAVPWIVTQGRKGGSSVAVAIVNALLRLAHSEPPEAI